MFTVKQVLIVTLLFDFKLRIYLYFNFYFCTNVN